MERRDADTLDAAVDALNEGELDQFVELMADDMVWTGQPSGWLWWRFTPT